jgi:hypothetical protein
MRTLLAALLLATLNVSLTGCPGGCGAYSGGNDKVYARGSDQLILCDNGGYVADVNGTTLEGYYTETASDVSGTDGATSQPSFDLTFATGTIPQFGTGDWQHLSLDQTALDHANVRCQALETRAWWAAPQP